MEYTINKLAKLAGVSTRTLRHYDQIKLLVPSRMDWNGYRIYGQKEIDRLQQILFYRGLGVQLEDIKKILSEQNFDTETALKSHLEALNLRKNQIETLIKNVKKTLKNLKGEITMTNEEKFDGFKFVEKNEEKYGKEIGKKYGDETVDKFNDKLKNMTEEQYAKSQKLEQEYKTALKEAFELGDPASEIAQKAADFHKQWLSCFCPKYTKEMHIGITKMHACDPRFTEYYDKIAPGCTEFLRYAVEIYCS